MTFSSQLHFLIFRRGHAKEWGAINDKQSVHKEEYGATKPSKRLR